MDELKARIAKLSPEKQKLLLRQLQNKNKDHFEERILPQKREHGANTFTLSYPQQRLFVLEQLMPGNLAYNAPLLFRLHGKLNLTAWKISLQEMAQRHEILRTTFHLQDEQPIQSIAPLLNVDVPVVDFRHLPPVEQEAEVQRLFQQETFLPFDLAQLPLWRTKLLQLQEEEFVLLLTIHHIIFDGWSVGVLMGELGGLYEAASAQKPASVPELPIQYADYALWQKQKLQGEFLNSQLDYWKKQLAGITPLQLLTDRPFSALQTTGEGATLPLEFPEALSRALKQLSYSEQTTLNMTTLAAFLTLLGRYTQQDDVAVGSVIANRNHREVEPLIGFFVNTIVLRSDLSDNPPFCELLKRVRKITLEAYEHREMPFDLLVEKLQPERDWSRNPLAQVGFAFQNAPTPVSQIGEISVHSIEVELSNARFDLELHLWEGTKGLEGTFVYKTSLFDAATIARMAAHFQRLLEAIVSNPTTRIQALPLLTDAEYEQILVAGNDTHTYVLDRHLQPVPIGVKGEIYIAGNNLDRDYLNDYSQIAQDFIPDPFSKKSAARLCKTGDFGRRLNNGSLEVLGSVHRTTWIKGFKVNLAEIEAALLNAPMVNDCVVLVRETTSSQQLVAYVVTTSPFVPERLQSHLEGRVPAHLLPDAYVPLTRLPLTKAGAVDHQVLTQEAVIDHNLIQEWEKQLRSLPEIEQVAVVVGEPADSLPALHLWELLPSKHRTPAASSPLRSTQAAISQSQPLPAQAITPTLASALKQAANSDKGLIYVQLDGSKLVQTYEDLLAEAEQILAGLRKQGLQPQDKIIFQLDNSQDFIPAFWACVLGGFVPVPISVPPSYTKLNNNASKLLHIWQMLEHPPILTRTHFAPEIQSLSSWFGISPLPLVTIEELRQLERDRHWHHSNPTDLAVLFLTSGSTGMPKAVMLTHRNLLSMSAGTMAMNGFDDKDTSLNWMPLDHVGALVFLSLMPTDLGCWQMHVPTEVILQNPLQWLDLIHHHRASISWAPNFAFTLICDRAAEIRQGDWDLSSMRFLVNAGEPIVAKTARNFLKLLSSHGLPSNAIHPAFGMCETCSGITWSAGFSGESSSDDLSFVELGLPIPGASIRIIDENQQVVAEGTIGRLQVKGDSVTSGYYQNPEVNQKAFTEDGWFNTGDLAFLHQGRLTITGREKELIIINGQNYYSHELEAVVEEVEGVKVSYTAACNIQSPDSNTEQLAIFFSSANSERAFVLSQIKEIRAKLNLRTGLNPDYIIPVTPESIPKTSLGKIERSRLRKQFAAGEFNEQLKQLDIEIENANTLPNWFFRKIWRRQQLSQSQQLPIPNQQTLVFVDSCGLAQYLCGDGESLPVQVEAGADFVQLSPHRYRINPNNPEHYLQLLKSLFEAQVHIQQILHLWTYEESITEISSVETLEQIQEQGVCSLLFLAQALVKVLGSEVSVQLYVISNHTQQVFAQQAIAAYKAPILGLLKTIPQEIPGITCRHIDFSDHRIAENATYLRQEMGMISKEPEVAFCKGQRWVPRLERVNLRQETKQELPFKPGGMYLISGGLGGIGVEIAKALIHRYSENPPRLLLLGRTPLPDPTTWSTDLQQDTRISQMVQAYQTLKQFGSQIIYQAIDVGDFAAVQQAVQQAESQWGGKLDGVIHLAGIPQQRMLVEETYSSLMAVLRPKMLGTWVLHRLIENQPDSLFMTFSSVNSFFGGATIGAYAAANSFVESFTKQDSRHLHSYCLTWSMWDEIGMSAGYEMKALSRVKGYCAIPLAAALHSLAIALHHNQKQIFIGLDGRNLSIRRYSETESHSLQRLKAYFTSSNTSVSRERLQQLMVSDRFGTSSHCDFLQVENIPRTQTSEVDWQKLLTGNAHQVSAQEGGETERQLAKIWQALLGIPQVNLEDNFFELGGNSLRATQLIAKVRAAFAVDLSVRHLFESQTVLGLSKVIQNMRQLTATTISHPESISKKTLPPCLITLQDLGNQPPLFFIHPIAGVVFPYYELSRELAPNQPVYGLQSVGLAGEGQPLQRVEDMAARYIEAMQIVQPEGPYHLAGWSSGATIAWEMAVQLQRMGQPVGLVALIDTPPPIYGTRGFWQMSKFFLNTVMLHIWPYIYDYFYLLIRQQGDLSQWLSLFKSKAMAQVLSQQSPLLEHEQPTLNRMLRVMRANIQASAQYLPTVYPGRVTLLRTNSDFSTSSDDQTWGWSQLAQGGVEVHRIPGNHMTLVKQPDVRELAQKLQLAMAKKTLVK